MASANRKSVLFLSDKFEDGHIHLSSALVSYLGLRDGPTDTLVFASVLDQNSCPVAVNKVIEVVFSVLKKGDFKVGQLPFLEELLVKCSSAEDANKLHHQAKVSHKTVIGFRKLKHVYIVPEMGNAFSKKIRDATPNEFKLYRTIADDTQEMRNILGINNPEPAVNLAEPEAVVILDDPSACVSKEDTEAGPSKKRKL